MGFPSICSFILLPKPLVVLVLLLDRIKLLVSTPFLYLGLYSAEEIHPLVPRPLPTPIPDGDHAYRLSATDLPAPSLPAPSPASIKRRLRVVHFAKLAARSSTSRSGEAEQEEDRPVCAVCLCGLAAADEVRELGNCRHAFHRGCIDRWVDQGQLTCPLCRSRLLPRRRGRRESWVAESISYLLGEELRCGSRRS